MNKNKRATCRIILAHGDGKRLADELGMSIISVSRALNGVRIVSPENYKLIRKQAVSKYKGKYLS